MLPSLSLVGRISSTLISLWLFLAITPQQKLEEVLSILPVNIAGSQKAFLTLPWSDSKVIVSAQHFAGLWLVLILALTLCVPAGRKIVKALAENKKAMITGFLLLPAFLFTLTPGPPLMAEEFVWCAAIRLHLSSLGLALLLLGILPCLRSLSQRPRFRQAIINMWNCTKQVFLGTKPALFLGVLFLVFFALTNLASYFLFEHIPHVKDSIAQVFHAKIFATGRLVVPSHQHPEFFDIHGESDHSTMINNGKWYSQYPPGHSFSLMLGIPFDAPWIINPLLGSLTIVLLYSLGKELFDERTGRLCALLGMLSPFVFFMSSEFMNHASALFFFTAFALFFAKMVRTARAGHALVAGLCLGMMLNIRPLTAVALALPFALFSCYLLGTRFRKYFLPIAAMAAAFLVLAGGLLSFNYLTNGDPFLFGYEVLYGPQVKPGFGHAAWGEPHTPMQGLRHTLNDLSGVNKFLFEWPVPSLGFVFLLFLSLTRNKWDYLLLASFGSLVSVYFFYWFHNWCFGPRLFYEASSALLVLAGRGILRLPVLLRDVLKFPVSLRKVHAGTAAFIALCVFIAACGNIPALAQEFGDNFLGVNAEVLRAVKKMGIKKAIVFTRSSYTSVLPANSPMLDGDIIYARDLGEKNRLLMESFPDYNYYLADGCHIELLQKPERQGE